MNIGQMYEEIARHAFERAKRRCDARDAAAMHDFLMKQHERQRKAEMDKVLWLPGHKAGDRFKGDAVEAEFEDVKEVILL